MRFLIILFSIIMLLSIPLSGSIETVSVEKETKDSLVVVIGQIESVDENQNDLYIFIEDIGEFESNGKYHVVNRWGMMGKYQFSPITVMYLGYDVSKEEFLSNPELQDEIMLQYLRDNYVTLKPYLEKFRNKTVKGVLITESSILAGAHFAGARGVIRFLTTDSTTVDSNGTTLSYYMNKFSDYDINVEEL